MDINQTTNETNVLEKLNHIEGLLDIIEYDIEQNIDRMKLNSNVLHILPNVDNEWKAITNNEEITLYELIDYCELWVTELATITIYNQGKLKNKKLLNHMCNIVNICRDVVKLTHNYFYNLNQ